MHLTFAHYRNRFCMFRTYYALAEGIFPSYSDQDAHAMAQAGFPWLRGAP